MGNNYDIILIGLVAVFLILRLRSVLGKRTGNERPPARDPFTPPRRRRPPARRASGDAPANQGNDNVVPLPTANAPAPRPSCATSGPGGIRATVMPTATAGVAAIRAADPSFEPIGFTGGARAAFTAIVEAFAKGDTASLRPLLDAPTFASFEAAIRGRVERKRKGGDDADRLRGLRHRRRRDAGQQRQRHGPLRQRADQRRCATPTARSSTAIPTKCRRWSISGRSVATPSPAIQTGC